MKALIDGDILLYEIGSAKKEDGTPLAWPLVVSRMNEHVENIITDSGSDSYEMFLTGPGNFRERVATIRPYKGNRPSEKPYWYSHLKEFLLDHWQAQLIEGQEADDELGIRQCEGVEDTVICSKDKDLLMIPGNHFNWHHKEHKEVTELQGYRWFFSQVLMGDAVDNIPGLFGVGKSSALVKKVQDMEDIHEMYDYVSEEYEKRFGSYWFKFLVENMELLWMRRERDGKCFSKLLVLLEDETDNV